MAIIEAIPQVWKQEIKRNTPMKETVYIQLKTISRPIALANSKEFYWIVNDSNKTSPKCKTKWCEKYDYVISDLQWKKIFCLPANITSRNFSITLFTAHMHQTACKATLINQLIKTAFFAM